MQVPSSVRTLQALRQPSEDTNEEALYLKLEPVGDSDDEDHRVPKPILKSKKSVSFKKQPLPPITRKRSSESRLNDEATSSPHDKEAMAVLHEFKSELKQLMKSENGLSKSNDPSDRGAYADYLTERYLSQRLDALPSSKVVTRVRRDIAQMIETFVQSGSVPGLPHKMSAPAVLDGAALSTSYTELAEKIKHSGLTSASAPDLIKRDVGAGIPSPIVLSEEDEKRRVKRQYEEYLKLKRESPGVLESPSGDTATLESTVADIKSLLSSLSLRKPTERSQR